MGQACEWKEIAKWIGAYLMKIKDIAGCRRDGLYGFAKSSREWNPPQIVAANSLSKHRNRGLRAKYDDIESVRIEILDDASLRSQETPDMGRRHDESDALLSLINKRTPLGDVRGK